MQPAAPVDFDEAVLGRGLAPEVEALIARAGSLRAHGAEAERLLLEAQLLAPDHPATLIALYRHYFYSQQLVQACTIAQQAIRISAERCAGAACDVRSDAGARFHLFALKGHAYLSLRLGQLEAGRAALLRLRQLDPDDVVGGAVLARVLARRAAGTGDGTDEDSGAHAGSEAPRGWPPEDGHVR